MKQDNADLTGTSAITCAKASSFGTKPRAASAARSSIAPPLHGESDYNITINSDLTVSCNCQDYNGSGHLGDLKKDSFEKVFFGPVAKNFREKLAKANSHPDPAPAVAT